MFSMCIDQLKVNFLKACCCDNKCIFLTMLMTQVITFWLIFIKISKLSEWFFHGFVLRMAKSAICCTNPYGNIAHLGDFYKISNRSEKSQTWCGDYLDH